MSEPSFFEAPEESVGAQPEALRQVSPHSLVVRFAFGAVTSVAAGALSLLTTPLIGGVMLAFPAILAASLTLIEEEEDARDAREDARGGIVGACALTLFAAVATLTFTHLPGGVVLALSTVVWAAGAFLGYVVLWWR